VGVAHGLHVRPIQVNSRAQFFCSSDGPVPRDEDIDVSRNSLEQLQGGEIVLDRISRVVQVEQRDQHIGQHVARDENPAFLNHQRRMARGMGLMFHNPDTGAIPRNVL
jgi:hypothetical protein